MAPLTPPMCHGRASLGAMGQICALCASCGLLGPGAASCRFTPWDIDERACAGVTIAEQLHRLQDVERAVREDEGIASGGVGAAEYEVALVGDMQRHPGSLVDALHHINRRKRVAFVFVLGDLTDLGLGGELAWTCAAMRRSRAPILAVIGNHDAIGFGATAWKRALGNRNYAFTFLNTKYVVFDNNARESGHTTDHDFVAAAAVAEPDAAPLSHLVAVSHKAPSVEPVAGANNGQRITHAFLAVHGYQYTLNAHQHRFKLRVIPGTNGTGDIVEYSVTDTPGAHFGIAVVTAKQIAFENCAPECVRIVTPPE